MMNKKNNILKIFVVIVCLAAVTVFALYEAGANLPFIQEYKNNFKKNISGISNMIGLELPIEMQLYLDDMSTPAPKPTMIPADEQEALFNALGYPAQEEVVTKEGTAALTTKEPIRPKKSMDILPVAFSSAENAEFAIYKGDIVCANETQYLFYSQKGEALSRETIQMQAPSMTVRGDYIMINETGERKISLYKGKKHQFTVKTEGNIISADLSENGDIVAVTEKEYYKGQVAVYNKNGKLVFLWDSGSYHIMDAAISNKRRVALSMLNTDSGADSFVLCMDLDGKEKFKTESFTDSVIFDVEYCGEKLNAVADNKCLNISSAGKVSWSYDYGGKKLSRYRLRDGYSLLVFDAESTGELVTLSPGGRAYPAIKTESMPKSVDIKDGYTVYNSGRDIIMTDLKGKKVLKASCDSDIKQLHIISRNKVLAVYSSSIQIKKPEKPHTEELAALPEGN